MTGCTLAQETDYIGNQIEECQKKNDCRECGCYDCPANTEHYEGCKE